MLINQHISRSVISTLLDFSPPPPPPPPPNQLSCVVCFLVLTLGWILHCPRKFTRVKIKLALVVIVSCLAVLFREHLLHSPPTYHININFITYWFFYTNKFSNLFAKKTTKKQRILKVFTIFFHFSHQTIASFLITTTLMNKSECFSQLVFKVSNLFRILSKLLPINTYSSSIFALLNISK